MKTRFFSLAAFLTLSFIAVDILEAQTQWTQSPTSSATWGRYKTDADDFIHVTDWTKVKFENRFLFGSFASDQGVLGYAQNVGSAYLGFYYSGNMLTGYGSGTKTESDAPDSLTEWTLPALGGTTDIPTGANNDRIAVLIGIANMGFRLGFYTNQRNLEESNVIIDGNSYKKYSRQAGSLVPHLAWGLAKPLASNGIKPWVEADLNFYKNTTRHEAYTGTSGEQIDNSQNYFQPRINIGMGGYDFHKGDALTLSFDLENLFSIAIYSNEYSYLDGTYKTGKIKGLNIKGSNDESILTENSSITDTLTPSVSASYKLADNLALKAKFRLTTAFRNAKSTGMKLNGSNDLIKDGADTKTTDISLAPRLDLALQYKILSNKLFFNIGGQYTPASWTWSTAKRSTYANDNEVNNGGSTRKTRTSEGNSTAARVGLTWNITDTISVDSATGVQLSGTNRDVNVFGTGTGSLTNFSSILLSMKF